MPFDKKKNEERFESLPLGHHHLCFQLRVYPTKNNYNKQDPKRGNDIESDFKKVGQITHQVTMLKAI